MISPVLIGGFEEMYLALLYIMPRNGFKDKEEF